MTEIEEYGFPFDCVEVREGEYDRGASSAEWARYVSSMFTNGYMQTPEGKKSGVEPMKVTAQAGMTVSIGKGAVMIEGRMRIFSQNILLSLDQADAQPRIDLVCMRLDLNAEMRKIYPLILKGDSSETPAEPVYIRDDMIYDLILAKVIVPANVAKLTQDDIVDMRNDFSYCGVVATSSGIIDGGEF